MHSCLIPLSVRHIIKGESLWTLWHRGIECSSFMNEAHTAEQVQFPWVKTAFKEKINRWHLLCGKTWVHRSAYSHSQYSTLYLRAVLDWEAPNLTWADLKCILVHLTYCLILLFEIFYISQPLLIHVLTISLKAGNSETMFTMCKVALQFPQKEVSKL